MSTIIQASELEIGDLYVTYSALGRDGAGEARVRQVTGHRTIRIAETYQVLETLALDGTRRGEMSLRADKSVERLDPVGSVGDLVMGLKYLPMGNQQLIVAHDGRLWT